MNTLQTHRRSLEASSDTTSYCERDTYEDEWDGHSTVSHLDEVATQSQSSGRCDLTSLRAERDTLARALAAERARAAAAARAHDARLAELHGVIAELVRRRAADKHSAAIPEEEASDECDSTTQPAGELEPDADRSRTDQNDTSSAPSAEPPPPRAAVAAAPHDTDTSAQDSLDMSITKPEVQVSSPQEVSDASVHLSERDSELCLSTARCCQYVRQSHSGSCEREHGSLGKNHTLSTDGCSFRQAKIASRVRLRRTDDSEPNLHGNNDESWCSDAAERLALDVCAQADLREALVAASNDGEALTASISAWKARCARLEADNRVMECALQRATDTAQKLSCVCAVHESVCVCVCAALRAADAALETYDVLLALAETQHVDTKEREAAELVATQLLCRLESEPQPALGDPLLSPGPWLQHQAQCIPFVSWSAEHDSRLRAHCARLKAETVTLRNQTPKPYFLSHNEISVEGDISDAGDPNFIEMEKAVDLQEMLSEREAFLARRAASLVAPITNNLNKEAQRVAPVAIETTEEVPVHDKGKDVKLESSRRRRRERHWLDSAETNL